MGERFQYSLVYKLCVLQSFSFYHIYRPLLFQALEDIPSNPSLGESLPYSVVLHFLFSQAPAHFVSPHTVCIIHQSGVLIFREKSVLFSSQSPILTNQISPISRVFHRQDKLLLYCFVYFTFFASSFSRWLLKALRHKRSLGAELMKLYPTKQRASLSLVSRWLQLSSFETI